MASATSRWRCGSAGKGYVLGVKSNHPFHSWGKKQRVGGTAEEIAQRLPLTAWRRLSAGAGTKRRAAARLGLSRTRRSRWRRIQRGARRAAWTRGLLIRRKIADGDLAFFTTWAPRERRSKGWRKSKAIVGRSKKAFETAKNELGLDHNETRSWHGWRRHVSLVMLAFAMMAAIRASRQ